MKTLKQWYVESATEPRAWGVGVTKPRVWEDTEERTGSANEGTKL